MIEGIVIFQQANQGSKSEMLAPYLYMGEGKFERIAMLDENPFMPNQLNEYDGVKVKLVGSYNDDEVFLVENIEKA